jgi:hypothetical protein
MDPTMFPKQAVGLRDHRCVLFALGTAFLVHCGARPDPPIEARVSQIDATHATLIVSARPKREISIRSTGFFWKGLSDENGKVVVEVPLAAPFAESSVATLDFVVESGTSVRDLRVVRPVASRVTDGRLSCFARACDATLQVDGSNAVLRFEALDPSSEVVFAGRTSHPHGAKEEVRADLMEYIAKLGLADVVRRDSQTFVPLPLAIRFANGEVTQTTVPVGAGNLRRALGFRLRSVANARDENAPYSGERALARGLALSMSDLHSEALWIYGDAGTLADLDRVAIVTHKFRTGCSGRGIQDADVSVFNRRTSERTSRRLFSGTCARPLFDAHELETWLKSLVASPSVPFTQPPLWAWTEAWYATMPN